MKTLLRTFLLVIFTFTTLVSAEPSNEIEFKKKLDELRVDYASTPRDQLETIDSLIVLAETNDWRHSELRAQVLKAELLLILEQIQSAQKIVDGYLPRTSAKHLIESKVRLILVQIYINNVQNKPFKDLVQQAEELIPQLENDDTIAEVHGALGNIYLNNGEPEKALHHQIIAREMYLKLDDEVSLSGTLNSLANIYSSKNERDTAIQYLKEALTVMRKVGDRYSESVILYNLADNYRAKKEYVKAQEALTESLAINQELEDIAGIAWTKQAIGLIFEEQKNFEKALLYFEQALAFFTENNDKRNTVSVSMGKINCLIELEKPEEASVALQELKPLVDEYEDKSWTPAYTRMEAKLSALNKDFKTAYEKQVEVAKAIQSYHEKQNSEAIQKLLVEHNLKKQEDDNRILQQENELQELRLKQKQKEGTIWRLAMAFVVLVMLVIGYLLKRILANRNHFQEMALKDHLTSAPNRRAILEFAEREFQMAKRTRHPLTFAIIDLDFFKAINDNFGHDVGDDVLKAFADALSGSLRSQDRFGRYGGEEWLLVLTNTPVSDVATIFERIKQNLKSIELPSIPTDYDITFSLGASQVEKKDTSLNNAINRADSHLYQAKETGRNKAIF